MKNLVAFLRIPKIKAFLIKVVIFVLSCLIFLTGGFIIGKFCVEPTYTATTDVIVRLSLDEQNYTSANNSNNNTILSMSYIPTIVEIVSSPSTAEIAKEIHGYDISFSAVSCNAKENSLIFSISYTDKDKESAVLKLNDVLEASNEQIIEKKPISMNKSELISSGNNTYIVKNTATKRYMIYATLIGALLSGFGLFVYVLFKNKNEENKVIKE